MHACIHDNIAIAFHALAKHNMPTCASGAHGLLVRHGDVARVDGLNDIVRRLAVDGAADGLGGAEDLLDAVCEVACERLGLHGPCNVDDLVERDVARVLDVLLLFTVARRLCGARVREQGQRCARAGRTDP